MIDWTRIPLHDREAVFSFIVQTGGLELETCPYAVLFEDPANPDAPMGILRVSDTWYSMALLGGILPPLWVYHELARDEIDNNGQLTQGHLLHKTPPVGPMSPEEAIEYVIEKDLPPRIWRDYEGNRDILRIVSVEEIPSIRRYRNAWRINQHRRLVA